MAIDTISQASSFTSSEAENPSWGQASTSEISTENQANIDFELEKLRIELRHIRGMYAMAQGEAIDASRKKRKSWQDRRKRDTKLLEEKPNLSRNAERETAERKEAEIRASRETKEKEKLESALNGSFYRYRQFTWDEIISATSSFSENLQIGMGAYGAVYQCSFQHTTAAVKILHAKEASRNKQFSRSLEDRLFRKNNTPPLLWFDRFRIAWEVASALVFLTHSKPKAIIHRDLKPANILLDRNNVSKIGDVGLSTMVNKDLLSLSPAYKDTAPVGTLCYIDPEYQRTGVVSPHSDVYAFGMVILQLLTAKPAIALAHEVELAVENNRLVEVLDPEAGPWPVEETNDLVLIALKCTELRRRDRPDLRDEVLPVLEKMKDNAETARNSTLISLPPPPDHFKCPILKEVMTDPCVAGDGYTYERKAIEEWLKEKDTSPMTNLQLPHKCLTPNYTLLSAIMEWKSRKH
ncbi:UNVERIFIED_CONTAM: U-box domain-containing protein 52 [Sesamum calycinum]|uniref:RING-type E3 ubiquitin transferase n=1 Tax=Sesamum calycinum TaxID=2727403 RepID=A0AAW2LR65_9LAMI